MYFSLIIAKLQLTLLSDKKTFLRFIHYKTSAVSDLIILFLGSNTRLLLGNPDRFEATYTNIAKGQQATEFSMHDAIATRTDALCTQQPILFP